MIVFAVLVRDNIHYSCINVYETKVTVNLISAGC